MPSPFPGMDPFLESQEWEDFHTTFNTILRERLGPSLEPDYLVRVERRVYQRARYDLSVKYDAPLDPPLNQDELRWVNKSPSNRS